MVSTRTTRFARSPAQPASKRTKPVEPAHERQRTRLYMAEGTVKTHIGRLLAKLQARDRVGLVLIAHECGLLD